jgi:hypothetical protein
MAIEGPIWRITRGAQAIGTLPFQPVVTGKAITKEGAAQFSDIRRCFHPAQRFRIELSKFPQVWGILWGRQLWNRIVQYRKVCR